MSKGKKWMLFGIITGSILFTLIVVGICIGAVSIARSGIFEKMTSKKLSDYYKTTDHWECDEYDLVLSYDQNENGYGYYITKTTFSDEEEPFGFYENPWHPRCLFARTEGETNHYQCGDYTLNKNKLKLKIQLPEYFNISEDIVLIFVPIYYK